MTASAASPSSAPTARRRPGPLAAAAVVALCSALAHPAAATTPAPAPTDPAVRSAVQEMSQAPTPEDTAAREAARTDLAEATGTDFYSVPDAVPARPGALLRHEPSVFYLDPVRLVQVPARATRIMYASQDAHGRPIAVTGTLLTPTAPWTGAGARPLIGYAVGTQGLGDRCAPSRTLSTGEQYEGVGITGMLSRGYSVVVTDYEGLGTEGTHTYMVRASQAHTVLDAVRAAREVPGSEVTAATPVALAGYSQGGGATAAAAELAHEYAPELDVRAAYAGAPPADLVPVADAIDGGLYAEFLLFALGGQLAAYDVDPAVHLNAEGERVLAEAEQNCVTDAAEHAWLDSSAVTASGQDFPRLVRTDPTLSAILAEQRLGAQGRAPQMPVMIAHSLTDDVIPYRVGREMGLRWCAAGARVRFDPVLTPTHVGGYLAAQPRALGFLDTALRGRTTLDSCGWF